MSQIKSKKRVADHGEVFTPAWMVEAMLDLVKGETERIDSRFLEPAYGDGNFLVQILRRKLAAVGLKYGESDFERRNYALLALMCLYGIELRRGHRHAGRGDLQGALPLCGTYRQGRRAARRGGARPPAAARVRRGPRACRHGGVGRGACDGGRGRTFLRPGPAARLPLGDRTRDRRMGGVASPVAELPSARGPRRDPARRRQHEPASASRRESGATLGGPGRGDVAACTDRDNPCLLARLDSEPMARHSTGSGSGFRLPCDPSPREEQTEVMVWRRRSGRSLVHLASRRRNRSWRCSG